MMLQVLPTVFAGVGVFLFVLLLLVLLLLVAKRYLTASGNMQVVVNNKDTFETSAGNTLLNVLSENNILLPAACGGSGSCGMCRCKVPEGGGNILPTEEGFFTIPERKDNWRLACQVKVNRNLNVEISGESAAVKKWRCEVVSNRNVATYIKEFIVKLPEGQTLDFQAGGYIQVSVPKTTVDFKDFEIEDQYREEWEKYGLFDLQMVNPERTYRAYSMANHPAEGNIIMLNIRIATPPFDRATNGMMALNPGICSSFVFSRKPGDKVTISGPYGEFFMKDTDNEIMFIGGGAGMAPMRSHIFDLFHTKKSKRRATFWYGARSLREAFYQEDFNEIAKEYENFSWTLGLSEPEETDNWTGDVGFIHDIIYKNYLGNHDNPEDIEYYLCGPPMMISAVQKMLYDLGVPDENVMFDDFGG